MHTKSDRSHDADTGTAPMTQRRAREALIDPNSTQQGDMRAVAIEHTRMQQMVESSPRMKRAGRPQRMADNHRNPILQRKVDLQLYAEKITDAPLARLLDFLGASDANSGTSYRSTVEKDYGFRTALEKLIAKDVTVSYGFLQAEDLMAAIRTEARITHRGQAYELDRTFRGADQARDSVYKVRRGEEDSVIKKGPDLSRETRITELVAGHPNVIRLLDRENDGSQIRLEYAEQGTLDSFSVQAVASARNIIRGIVAGLAHVHDQGVIHGDLGAKNVYIAGTKEQPVAKIADFGESKEGLAEMLKHLPNDISGGTQLLESIAARVNSNAASAFIDKLGALRTQALSMVRQAEEAMPVDQEKIELYAVLGEEPPPPGPPLTEEQIAAVRREWGQLLEHPFLAV